MSKVKRDDGWELRPRPPANGHEVGTRSELIAAAWLLSQGYDVFRNLSPAGPGDLACWNPETGEFFLVDVKTAITFVAKRDGTRKSSAASPPRRTYPNLRFVCVFPGTNECRWIGQPQGR